ncbi:MAG TPA: hypothetical protein VFM49_16505 [Chloroflexia bacterium]|jgi:hypothetical protein|nr:hypothetical protein [Chloroflexia bacterium]
MALLLTILSALEVLTFVGALVAFLARITKALEAIGGKADSSLAKLAFGLRAIEKETSHLAPQVTQLNAGLTSLGGKLALVDGHLQAVAETLTGGKGAGA